jgi:hypothetical protein
MPKVAASRHFTPWPISKTRLMRKKLSITGLFPARRHYARYSGTLALMKSQYFPACRLIARCSLVANTRVTLTVAQSVSSDRN